MKFSKVIFLCFVLMSCADTDTIELEAESEKWLTGYDYQDIFTMIDENNITQSWTLTVKDNYFNEGTSGILFITTDRTYRQMTHESFQSDVLGEFSVSVNADYAKGNDYISFGTDQMNIDFTLKDLNITNFNLDYGNGERIYWDNQFDDPLNSQPILVESQELRGKMYGETLIFRLEDFQHGLSENDIIAFYYTKAEGLIYLELKSGLKYYRK